MRYLWLVDVETPGLVLRYALERVTVVTALGVELDYAQGLDDLEIGQGDPEVDVKLTDAAVDWPAVGPLLDGSKVTIRRWLESSALEQAEVYATGTATEPEWGSRYEPAEFTLRSAETLLPMPDLTAKVSTDTTAEDEGVQLIAPGQSGLYYPVILGFPGYLVRHYAGATSGLITDLIPVVPLPMRIWYPNAIAAPNSQLVVSHDSARCLPATVLVREETTGLQAALGVIATTDELGRAIGVATFTDFRLFALPDDGPTYLGAYGPGAGTMAPRSAYDVLVYVLELWGGDSVDWERIPEIRDHLDGYQVDTWISEPILSDDEDGPVWTWLTTALGVGGPGATSAAGLPIAIRTSAQGRYFVALRYTTDPARTIRTIDVSRGEAQRMSGLQLRGQPANLLELRYGYDLSVWAGDAVSTNAQLAALTVISTSALTSTTPSGPATQSVSRYGPRVLAVDAPWTWDAGTVVLLGRQLLERDALPWRYVRYRVPEEWELREGQQVELVDEEIAIDELAIVDGSPLVGGDGVTVTFRMPGIP